MKVQITKLYLVQVLDNEGNEVACEYVFGDKEEAKETGKRLKEETKADNTIIGLDGNVYKQDDDKQGWTGICL